MTNEAFFKLWNHEKELSEKNKSKKRWNVKAENGFIFSKSFGTNYCYKYVNMPEKMVLYVDLSWRCNRVCLFITVAEWDEENESALVNWISGFDTLLTTSKKRKLTNYLVKATHDYSDEKIIQMWKEYITKKENGK